MNLSFGVEPILELPTGGTRMGQRAMPSVFEPQYHAADEG
jgi:hypothetical protein